MAHQDDPLSLKPSNTSARPESTSPYIVITTLALVGVGLVWRSQLPVSHGFPRARDGRRDSEGRRFGVQPYFFGDGGKAKFNGTPQEWRLLPLDPACEPRQLVAPLLNASRHAVPSAEQLVIMFFGDRSV